MGFKISKKRQILTQGQTDVTIVTSASFQPIVIAWSPTYYQFSLGELKPKGSIQTQAIDENNKQYATVLKIKAHQNSLNNTDHWKLFYINDKINDESLFCK